MVTVKEFVMQSDHSTSVCLSVFVINRNHKNNNDTNRNRRDCTNELLTAEAHSLTHSSKALVRQFPCWREE